MLRGSPWRLGVFFASGITLYPAAQITDGEHCWRGRRQRSTRGAQSPEAADDQPEPELQLSLLLADSGEVLGGVLGEVGVSVIR